MSQLSFGAPSAGEQSAVLSHHQRVTLAAAHLQRLVAASKYAVHKRRRAPGERVSQAERPLVAGAPAPDTRGGVWPRVYETAAAGGC